MEHLLHKARIMLETASPSPPTLAHGHSSADTCNIFIIGDIVNKLFYDNFLGYEEFD